jgi:hypothetical protein
MAIPIHDGKPLEPKQKQRLDSAWNILQEKAFEMGRLRAEGGISSYEDPEINARSDIVRQAYAEAESDYKTILGNVSDDEQQELDSALRSVEEEGETDYSRSISNPAQAAQPALASSPPGLPTGGSGVPLVDHPAVPTTPAAAGGVTRAVASNPALAAQPALAPVANPAPGTTPPATPPTGDSADAARRQAEQTAMQNAVRQFYDEKRDEPTFFRNFYKNRQPQANKDGSVTVWFENEKHADSFYTKMMQEGKNFTVRDSEGTILYQAKDGVLQKREGWFNKELKDFARAENPIQAAANRNTAVFTATAPRVDANMQLAQDYTELNRKIEATDRLKATLDAKNLVLATRDGQQATMQRDNPDVAAFQKQSEHLRREIKELQKEVAKLDGEISAEQARLDSKTEKLAEALERQSKVEPAAMHAQTDSSVTGTDAAAQARDNIHDVEAAYNSQRDIEHDEDEEMDRDLGNIQEASTPHRPG